MMKTNNLHVEYQVGEIALFLKDGLTRREIVEKIKHWGLSMRVIDRRIAAAKKYIIEPTREKARANVEHLLGEYEMGRIKNAKQSLAKVSTMIRDLVDEYEMLIAEKREKGVLLPVLTTFATAKKSGVDIEKLVPLLRLEAGEVSQINENKNSNLNIDSTGTDVIIDL